MDYTTIHEALAAFKAGKFAIVVDDNNKGHGELVLPGDQSSTAAIDFMLRHTNGIVNVAMDEKLLRTLGFALPTASTSKPDSSNSIFSVDATATPKTTSSARDRATTIEALLTPCASAADFRTPGHVGIFSCPAGGVLRCASHREAAIDLARLANFSLAAVTGELFCSRGNKLKRTEIDAFAKRHKIPIVAISDLIRYRRQHEKLTTRITSTRLPTSSGEFQAYAYYSHLDGIEHVALVKGDVRGSKNVLVRVHSECMTGDIFGSLRCDCGPQLALAMQTIDKAGAGVVIYLRGHEGRGIGIGQKLRAYNLQDQGRDTVEANIDLGLPVDARDYGAAADILKDLEISSIRLLSNNPAKLSGLEDYSLKIVERVPLIPQHNTENIHYLMTKKNKMGHFLDIERHPAATPKLKTTKVKA
jgi:3,4-dihydroxy 2-butanone 4-phosphate synthase/GTP cyclohydrolase II